MPVYHFFVISLHLCTQYLFTEVEMNNRGYFRPTRKEMILMIDKKQFSALHLESLGSEARSKKSVPRRVCAP